MPDELLTIDEVAAELKLHPDTIRRYIRQKRLKAVRIGATAKRIRRSELEKFLKAGEELEEDQE